MFKVRDKKSKHVYTVYSTNRVGNETEFLFNYKGRWMWMNSNNYEPLETDTPQTIKSMSNKVLAITNTNGISSGSCPNCRQTIFQVTSSMKCERCGTLVDWSK